MTTKYRLNDEDEYKDLKGFMDSDKWNRLPKRDKEDILRRIHVLEHMLGYDLTRYNG